MKPDGIILDIDGTLWNSTGIVADAWNDVVDPRPDVPVHFTPQQLQQLFGKTLPHIADLCFPFLEPEQRYPLIEACCEREHEFLRESRQNILYPGVAETIRSLSKTTSLFIVSNCQSGYIELFLEKTGLGPCIRDFECPGHTGLEKGSRPQSSGTPCICRRHFRGSAGVRRGRGSVLLRILWIRTG